jgi:hypothetical protein
MGELLVAIGDSDIIMFYFRMSFQTTSKLLLAPSHVINPILSKFALSFLLCSLCSKVKQVSSYVLYVL